MATHPTPPGKTRPTIGHALVLLVAVSVAVAGFILIGHVLRIEPVYAGLLFFTYWITIDDGEYRAMPAAVAGALGGTGTAWLLQLCALRGSGVGLILVLLLILFAIFMQILERAPIVFNRIFVIFLTVTAAPLLQKGEDFRVVFLSILLAVVWFGLFVFGAKKAIALRQPRAARLGD